jgi:hypothetical protein
METRLEQRVTELQTEVNQIVAEIQRLRHNPPADVAAPQQKVDAAIVERPSAVIRCPVHRGVV